MKGGSAPYNLSIAAVGAETLTVVPLDLGIDKYTWIDRGPPGGMLLGEYLNEYTSNGADSVCSCSSGFVSLYSTTSHLFFGAHLNLDRGHTRTAPI